MSASVLSSIYDLDLLYRQEKSQGSNAVHLNNVLDRRTVGIPLSTSNKNNNRFNAGGYFRANSISHMDSISGGKESPTPAYMNKENKFRDRAFSETGERGQQLQELLQPKPGSQINSTRYKTELCRPFEENGSCKYGEKCQFAHGYHELRNLSRHPKYKTEPCRTFHTIGFCPYGPRCHFIHNVDERRAAPNTQLRLQRGECALPTEKESAPFFTHKDRPRLHHSLSFSGFSSSHGAMIESPTSRTPPPPTSCALSFFEDSLAPSPHCLNAFGIPEQDLKAFLAPLIPHAQSAFSGQASYGPQPSPPFPVSSLAPVRLISDSPPVFDSPPSPLDSLSDPESFVSGSRCSSGTISGSESPSLDSNRRLPIFSRLSISDD
ncbi:hypothetical protein PDJAM_G00038900 [Pangasius djambal]|uniref:Uncharacterized protein n=1 Tax=Pangasius djambal TaxID=1691987 RepID=A0ACC5YTH0_9TELE|nr:hypothetical protein [Pangasius djambal]